MSGKPVIGINGDFRAERKDAVALSWFNTGYYDSVTAAGGLPALIPPLADEDDLSQYVNLLDGVVLSGCNLDLDPVRLGLEKHPTTRPMPNRREDFDRRLAKMAVKKRKPILAIGGGMQTLNVIWGMAGMINLGLAGFFALGAYASALATVALGLPIALGILVAIASAGRKRLPGARQE